MAQDANQVTANPDEVRARIEQTRSDMAQTLARIQDRLSPSRLTAEMKRSVRHATLDRVKVGANKAGSTVRDVASHPAETASKVAGVVRRHPIPAALVALISAWWVVRAVQKRSRRAGPFLLSRL